MQTYDVVIIGAGHNGLVCAAYLLKAGYTVLLLDKNAIPGGASTTEELLPDQAPGFKFNPCAIDHIFIHLGPVVEELQLSKYRAKYGVISSLDAKRLFGQFIDQSDIDAADAELGERVNHRLPDNIPFGLNFLHRIKLREEKERD